MLRLLRFALAASLVSVVAVPAFAAEDAATTKAPLFADIETSMGTIVVKFYEKEAPKTVANFVELAEGKKEFVDPATGARVKRPFYDGLLFHRVIRGFMIQGGCPLSHDTFRAGTGGPGYRFEDEIDAKLDFDKPGYLAMANAGPNTNGSQFFITVAPTPHLKGRHTIFGQVVKGMEIATKISEVETGPRDRPFDPITVKKVTIYRADKPK